MAERWWSTGPAQPRTGPPRVLTLPVDGPAGDLLRAVRRGEVPLDEVLARLGEAEAELTRLRTASDLPEQPDREWVDGWLHRAHTSSWAQAGAAPGVGQPG